MDPLSYLNLPGSFINHESQEQQAVDDLSTWLLTDFNTISDINDLRNSISTPQDLVLKSPVSSSSIASPLSHNTISDNNNLNPSHATIALASLLQSNPSIAKLLTAVAVSPFDPPFNNTTTISNDVVANISPTKPSQLPLPSKKISFEEKTPDEQNKRRRNTLASAKFRQKRKLEQQALEKSAKDMSMRVDFLEQKVKEYEMEIKWLRSRLTERDCGNELSEISLDSVLIFTEGIFATDNQPSSVSQLMPLSAPSIIAAQQPSHLSSFQPSELQSNFLAELLPQQQQHLL